MDIDGAKVLVVGATGTLGGLIAGELRERGAVLAATGRDRARVEAVGATVAIELDIRDAAACAGAIARAAEGLGGLDGLVIASGAVAFGAADELSDDVAAELFAVNALGPIALVGAALGVLGEGGAIAALSAVVADHPTAGMAAYSASKAALSAYLEAVRREARRRGVSVLDVRPPHLDTPFSERALAGEPPRLPGPHDPVALARLVVEGMAGGRRSISYDLGERALVVA